MKNVHEALRALLVFPILTAFLVLLSLPLQAEGNGDRKAAYYRYTMPDGRVEIGRQVPQSAIGKGYEVLDSRMKLIRKVKPAPSAEEVAAREIKDNQRQSDEKLLQLFATSDDAKRARDRKIEALDVIVNISRGNIRRLTLEYETLVSRAAAKVRRGEEVPELIQTNMKSIERQIQDAKEHIAAKEEEKEKIAQSYQPDIERLLVLEGQVAAGKTNASNESEH